ncbi:MAG: Gfo/Idh/MocA family oxidoreductase [Proteobacteria bacterium]|nr:Gfo/Idh/MocA family oxidoreductase [Pseudomonadota bacterium]
MNGQAPTPPIGIGIVGCGNAMDGAYMPVVDRLQQQGKARLIGATHTSRRGARAVLKKWRIPKYFDTLEALLASGDIDVVVVLTPMRQHAAIAAAALAAGKHVLVEKPMAVTLPDARRLLAAAKRARRHLLCAPFVTLSPTFSRIRARIEAGDIGKVCLARARYGWAGPDWSEWFYQRGGGPIFDLAVYNLTSLTALLGPARRVSAMTGIAQAERRVRGRRIRAQVPDNVQITLDFGRSVFATVTSGFTMQKYRSPAIELYGTEGTLQLMGDDWAPDGYELWRNAVGAWQVFGESDPHWQWTQGLVHLVDCLRQHRRPDVRPEHAYHVLEVMLAAERASRTGRAQPIRSRFRLPPLRTEAAGADAHRIHNRPTD